MIVKNDRRCTMIELPEARTIASDLNDYIIGKKIVDVAGNYTDHKFTFYYKDPTQYKKYLVGKKITNVIGRNYYVEVEIEDYKLIFRDGANIRYYKNKSEVPKKSKLLLEFEDESVINITTSMYSFISVFHGGDEMTEDKYYNWELTTIGALDSEFTYDYFQSLVNEETLKLSLKAFLATNQRIPGIGNGTLQDILFHAKLHPKRKLNTLSENELKILYQAIRNTLMQMVEKGGRDTEKNIFGENGGYKTILSSKTWKNPCPLCHGEIKKENFLGGSIYYCVNCQK